MLQVLAAILSPQVKISWEIRSRCKLLDERCNTLDTSALECCNSEGGLVDGGGPLIHQQLEVGGHQRPTPPGGLSRALPPHHPPQTDPLPQFPPAAVDGSAPHMQDNLGKEQRADRGLKRRGGT